MGVVTWRSADHIGRIGALAVALGVGAAIATGHAGAGTALAEDSTSSSDASSSDTSGSAASQSDSAASESSTDNDGAAPSRPKSDVSANGDVRDDASESEAPSDEDDDEAIDDEADDDDRDDRRSRADVDPAKDEPSEDEPTEPAEPAEPAEPSEDEPAEPAEPASVVTSVQTAAPAPLADDGEAPPPADSPVSWVLAAAARREIGDAVVEAPQQQPALQTLAAHAVVDEEPQFTGQPSLITQVFVAGLRLIKPILGAFGIELNGTSARIPFFTDGVPPFFVTYGLNVRSDEYEGWKVWTLAPRNPSEKVVVAVHGGSFISTASLFHWSTYADLARATDATVVVPLYPLANAQGTGGTAKTVVPVMADFIAAQVAEHGAENVSVLGDSAGGNIALAAAQELVRRCKAEPGCDTTERLPGRLVLLAPALDSSLSNPAVADVDDPLLSPASSRRNGLWWSKGLESDDDPTGTRNPLASPLFGSLDGLPPTTIYAGELDLRTPDVLLLREKALATPGADFTFELRKGQIHDWVIFGFLPDARAERPNIYRDLGLTDSL